MPALLRLSLVLVAAVAVLLGALLQARTGLIYVFDSTDARPVGIPRTEVRQIPAFREDPALTVWVTAPEGRQPVVIYFMGQSGSLAVEAPRLRRLAEAGFGIAAMAYRGGGGQDGEPTAAMLHRDALRVFAGLDGLFGRAVPYTDRVIYGYSLGSGLAARLAEEQEELALIVEAPFTDLCSIKSGLLAAVPGCWLYAGQDFDTLDRIARVDAPLLILHGRQDRTVPLRQAEMLFAAAAEPKFIEIYEDGGHENLSRLGATEDVATFISTLRGVR